MLLVNKMLNILFFVFQGTVEFIESDEFQVQVNVTAPDTKELAKVHFNYTENLSSALLQVVSNTGLTHWPLGDLNKI